MAGYLGSEAVFLSASLAEIKGDSSVGGDLSVSGNITVEGSFTSQGIDDNATSTSLTIDNSGNLLVGTGGILRLNRSDETRYTDIYNNNSFFNIETSADAIKINGQGYIRLDVNGTERMRIDDNGVLNTTNGITFGAGTDILNDYEEGTWVPNIVGEVTNGSGTYTKIGSIVTAHFWIELPNIGFSTDAASLEGMPYSSNYSGNTDSRRSAGYLSYNTDSKAAALLFETVTRVHFRADPGGAALDRGTLAGNSYWGTLVYTTDS